MNKSDKHESLHGGNVITKTISEDYDPLWTMNTHNYLLEHLYLEVYTNKWQRDFIAFSQNGIHQLYIGKTQREKLSEQGFERYYNKFNQYKTQVQKLLQENRLFLRNVQERDFMKMSNKDFIKDFEKSISHMKKMWNIYFWTDYFCSDKVSLIIEKERLSYNFSLLKKHMQEMGNLKWKQRAFLNKTFYPGGVLEKYGKEMSRRMKLDKEFTEFTYMELIRLLKGISINIPDRSIWIRGKSLGEKEIYSKKAKEIIQEISTIEIDNDLTVLKGQIGNRGFYKGRVRKIEFTTNARYSEKIQGMKKGEVLVSGTTGPELTMACKKAGAIITEEGGIISHAVVISRELGIPCIVGTKIATKVLRDGDLVEVNANKGVITVIKRKK